jgi:hypothetical protein
MSTENQARHATVGFSFRTILGGNIVVRLRQRIPQDPVFARNVTKQQTLFKLKRSSSALPDTRICEQLF